MQDRADVGVLLVDHPVLDRVDRDAARLDAGRDAEDDAPVLLVVVRDEQDVAARAARASTCRRRSRSSRSGARPCASRGCRRRGRRCRRGASRGAGRARRARPRSGTGSGAGPSSSSRRPASLDLRGDLVAVPELGLEVGAELVVDHEPSGRERQAADSTNAVARARRRSPVDEEVALLHRREPDALAGHVAADEIRERANEERVLRGETGRRGALVQRGGERSARVPAEGPRLVVVDEVEHEVGIVDARAK